MPKTLTVKKQLQEEKSIAKKEAPTASLKNAEAAPVKADISKLAGKKLTGMRKADGNNASIEGTWTFALGDYYFQTSTNSTIYVDFDATLEGTELWFDDPSGEEIPFVAAFDAATNKLTFNRELIAKTSSYYIYQQPYVYMSGLGRIDQTIYATYYPADGEIVFSANNGLAWEAYADQAGAGTRAGFYGIYDLEGAVVSTAWKDLGEASFLENIIYSNFGQNTPANTTYTTHQIYASTENPGVYKLMDPFSALYARLGFDATSPQMIIDASDPNDVKIAMQSTGINGGTEHGLYQYFNNGWYKENKGQDLTGVTCTLTKSDDGTATITIPYRGCLMLATTAGSIFYASPYESILKFQLPEGEGEVDTDTPVVNSIYYLLNREDNTAQVTGCASTLTNLNIPATIEVTSGTYTVTSVAASAFYNNKTITSATIPATITEVGTDAFRNMTNLRTLNIADLKAWCAINFVNGNANPLYNVFPTSTSQWGKVYIAGEQVSTDLVIPEGVTSIGRAFYGFKSLTSVTFPSTLVTMGDQVFANCEGLTEVVIPEGVTEMGSVFFGCKNLASVTLPSTLETLKGSTFYNCNLTEVVLPASLKTMGSMIFSGNYKLTKVTCYAVEPPTITGYLVFEDDAFDGELYVPEGSEEAYRAANVWKDFTNIIGVEVEPEDDGIVSAPYTADFSVAGEFDKFIVIDNNNDNSTWHLDEEDACYTYNDENAADDYLVLPIKLEAGKNYNVIVSASSMAPVYPEKFEVKVGKAATVEGLNITALSETTVASSERADFEGNFTADETGVWYVAIHAISDANVYNLFVRKLTVELGPEATAPAAVVDLVATAGAAGATEATLTFTAPANAINGSALTGTEDIKVYRDDALVNTLEGVTPGTEQSWTDTGLTDGQTYTYYVVAENESGMGVKSEKVSVYVGQDMPADVENIKVTAMTDNTITFSWDAVKGVNGGYIDTENVKYELKELLWGGYSEADEALATTIGQTTATIDYPNAEGDQEIKFFGVKAIIGDNNTNILANKASVIAGAPYELPIEETFTGHDYDLFWVMSENGGWYFDSQDELGIITYNEGTVTLESGKLNLKPAVNPTLIFDAKKGNSPVNELTIYSITPDGTTADIETITLTEDNQTYTVTLPATLKNEVWSRIGFSMNFPTSSFDPLTLDNIKVVDLLENNLSVAVSAPASVIAGSKAAITATVKNEGAKPAEGYTVVIKAGEEELLNQTVSEALESFATATFTAELETSIFDEEGTEVAITATVTYAADENNDNNTAETTVTITEPKVPGVGSVTAVEAGNGIEVTWTAPDTEVVASTEVTEGFEDGQGDWTFIDADGDGDTWTWDEDEWGWTAHNGSRGYLKSHSWTEEPFAADNWLVSPEAVLDGTFKFWAKGSEKFQVYVSTESATDVTTFTEVSDLLSGGYDYEEYTVDLSAYAGQTGWIAIRHFNSYDWDLAVDDITYLVGEGVVDIANYNIYVDGELKTTAAADQLTTTIEGVAAGDHTVAVSVVYANGKESKPVETTVTVSTGIDSITVITKPVDVYTLDGKLVRKQATTLSGLKGVYIVGGKKVVLK